ncbi:MAG: glycogen debranching protein GlgX [Actinomycetota bacterium]
MALWPGRPSPMGATPDAQGTNFAVYSALATPGSLSLCLFAEDGTESQLPLSAHTGSIWHGYVPGVRPGQLYGFRANGPWYPHGGVWCNQAKLLLDPWARAMDLGFDGDPSTTAHLPNDRSIADPRDSSRHIPRSVVVDPSFDWGSDKPPGIAMADTVIYETHVRGLTRQHPGIPDAQRGTYAGLATAPVISHLTSLGVTAVELMPVHHFVSEARLLSMGLTNYWGYESIGFFAPHAVYSSSGTRGQQVTEFKNMVKALHDAGLEVILDVVYNHTAEGPPDGPTLAFRGLDNPTYYRLAQDDPSSYVDYTGTGNTLNTGDPEVLRLITASLRYWVTEMHVDGFRFDLASVLARQYVSVDRYSAFLDMVYQDPVISQVKLIAEPWDTKDGYYLGHFPTLWSSWNDRYRGGIRDLWRAQQSLGELATRLSGSDDIFQAQDLTPQNSINYLTSHDGFTLADLVAYNGKHNEANGESNRDGSDDNRSWNCGAEGPTSDPAVQGLRARQRRNLLATLLLSQGVPMILGGDEIGRTQQGNNNAYCQDSPLSWYDWQLDQERKDLLAFTRLAIGLRRAHPIFRRHSFFRGQPPRPGTGDDVAWLWLDGNPMTPEHWNSGSLAMGVWLNGGALTTTDDHGAVLSDDSFLLLVNASWNPAGFTLPDASRGAGWLPVLDTNQPTGAPPASAGRLAAGAGLTVGPRSLILLRRTG